jgi:hypothetical protein
MQEFEARAEPLNLSHAFPALTGDIIMDYFFGFNYAQLKHPEFESFHDAFIKIGGVGHVATQLPMIMAVGLHLNYQPYSGVFLGLSRYFRGWEDRNANMDLVDYEQYP